MAQEFYNFEGLAENANPVGNGWTVAHTSTAASSTIVLGTTPVGTRFWRITGNATGMSSYIWGSGDAPAWSGQMQILALMRRKESAKPLTTTAATFRITTGAAGDRNMYFQTYLNTQSTQNQIRKITAGTNSFVSGNFNIAGGDPAGDWFWVRFQINWTGSTNELKAKAWRTTETEPGWGTENTDAGLGDTTKNFGLSPNFESGQEQDIAWFSVGTAGQEAPGPSDASLAFTTAPTVTSRTTDSYTIGGTANQDCTVFAVATATTATDPDGPQIAAGTDGDDAAAPGTGSVAATANTAFSLSITGTFTEATHDLHIVARREAE